MSNDINKLRSRLEQWLADYISTTDLTGFVVGVSGGIDSALCAKLGCIAAQKTGKTIKALSLPISYGGRIDGRDMSGFYEKHQIPSETFDLSAIYHAFLELMPVTDLVIRSNIRTRLRATALYTYANERKLLVLGTMNRLEFAIGYFQKQAAIGDILPLARLSKGTIRDLGASYGLPEELIQRKASGCVHGQNAEDEWGIPEVTLDRLVTSTWEPARIEGVEPEIINKVQTLFEKTKHKRMFPPIFEP
jgi:NAD+ synthase